MDSEAVRASALAAAALVYEGAGGVAVPPGVLTSYADQLVPWIIQLPAVALDVTVSVDGTVIMHSRNGGEMATTLTLGTNTKVDILVQPKDANDLVTTDAIAFTTDDAAGNILTASVSADGRTWTGTVKAGVTGTVNVTANDTTTSGIPAFTEQVNVVAGATTHLVGTVTVT
jgi:hypothetical protein